MFVGLRGNAADTVAAAAITAASSIATAHSRDSLPQLHKGADVVGFDDLWSGDVFDPSVQRRQTHMLTGLELSPVELL